MAGEKGKKQELPSTELRRFESNVQFAQVICLKDSRGLIVGTSDTDRPSSIILFRLDTLERVFEVQAHSQPITRMIVNYENSCLFTGSQDGSLGMWEINQKQKNKEGMQQLVFSKEILCERAELQALLSSIDNYNEMNEQLKKDQKIKSETKMAEIDAQIKKENENKEREKANQERIRNELQQEIDNMERKYNQDLERKRKEHEDYLQNEKIKHEEKKD